MMDKTGFDIVMVLVTNIFAAGAVYGAIRADIRAHDDRLKRLEQTGDSDREAYAHTLGELHERISRHVERFHTGHRAIDRDDGTQFDTS